MRVLQLSIVVILSFSLITCIDAAFAENVNNTSNFTSLPEISDTSVPRGGFIQVLFATDPVYPNLTNQTNLEFDFVNKASNSIQQDVDYEISINQGSTELYVTPITHTSHGSVSLPFQFQNSGEYQIIVEVYGISFEKIPPEIETFTVTVLPPSTSYQSIPFGMPQNNTSINQSLQNLNSTTTALQQSNSVSTDKASYRYGDTISITGTFSGLYNNTILNFFILNPDQKPVSNHGFIAGSDGKFYALVVATGPKWNMTGTYTVILKSSQGTIAQKSFSFIGQEIPTPEFGSMVGIISICAIIGMIVISRKFNYQKL